ncbi:ATP-dependent DNA helicase [Mangrovimicrobium sediminis]|uniref:ATP-dependent DNA helicase n=1 Tax=Mangrovimicrobium sediminis TaxID=2562682 RepID=A0A4Z0LZG7_9GAMM|nr:ATP-dependent DNA helicase [Haliea sp. SAOS-164]TGD72600.1 ATP-dependent DNA helicase [Haliea sp. SAOS-164]
MSEFRIGVRDLAAFCHRSGDIDHRFTPSPTGEQGVEGHQRIYRRRPASYRREYAVSLRHSFEGVELLLQGRADGYDPEQGLVEEIKTCRVEAASIPAHVSQLHLAQARLYAAIIAADAEAPELTVRLTWLNIDSDEEAQLEQRYSAAELADFLELTLQRFSTWLHTLDTLRRQRDESLATLAFPHGEFRPGQRDIAELTYKCIDRGGQLLVEAPTGIGKTAAVLYPALKALGRGKHDALVFVTFRTVGRRAAQDCLHYMREHGLAAGSLSLTAKEAICLSPGSACHGDDCPFARGYYDRLPAALQEAVGSGVLDSERMRAIGESHQVCPYQLAEDLLPWMDIVVADAHYVYSLNAGVGQRFAADGRRWSALVDEAHNLPERARDMYSARLLKADLMRARRTAPAALKRPLDALNRAMLALGKEQWAQPDWDSREQLPERLLNSMGDFVAAVGAALADDARFAPRNPEPMEFFFAVLQWLRVAEQWDVDYRFELARGEGSQGLALTLNCLSPARLLAAAHTRSHALVAFSATLSPQHWTREALGLDPSAVSRRLDSPFAAQQLKVEVETGIDTRYQQRAASLPALAARILAWWRDVPGNCIVYFPAYRYLLDCLAQMRVADPALAGRHLWQQTPGQSAADRQALFELFDERRDVAALCILGGVYGEGIDLPGELLSSVVIVGVGLPQVGREREQLRAWYEARGEDGFDFAYRYPGMQRVAQALGRVVRDSSDHGRALLVDPRYGQAEWRALLPPWWEYSAPPY